MSANKANLNACLQKAHTLHNILLHKDSQIYITHFQDFLNYPLIINFMV